MTAWEPTHTVVDVLAARLADSRDRNALTDSDTTLTYGETWDQARRLAGGLRAAGVAEGERVLVMMDNHVDNALAWAASAMSGAVHICLNTAYKGELLRKQLMASQCRVVCADAAYLPVLAPHLREVAPRALLVRGGWDPATVPEVPGMTVVSWAEARRSDAIEPYRPQPWELAEIRFTSGTTGPSKGVLVSHAHAYQHATPVFPGSIGPDDVNLVAVPLFHLAGTWALVYNGFTVGACSAIVERFSVSKFWSQVREYGATHTILLGVMAEFLHRQPELPGDADNPLRLAYTMPVRSWFRDFERRFGLQLYTCYGSTEACQPLFAPPGTLVEGGCGTARPEFEVELVDPYDQPVGVDTPGELVVRPRKPWTVMLGYDHRPEDAVAAWRNQWLHTGDLLRRDAAGQYYFLDRVRDAIRRRGENISATEVEQQIIEYPDVEEVAVIGVESEYAEQEIMAVIVPAADRQLAPQDMIEFLRVRLPDFMLPRYVELRDSLPRTATAKVRKSTLREQGVTAATWDREQPDRHRDHHGTTAR